MNDNTKIPLCNNECYEKVNHGVQCGVSDGKGFVCSRLIGHEMPHVACGVEHELSVWDEGCQCKECLIAVSEGKSKHDSDCAVHNEPAYPNGVCNCRVSHG